MRNIRTNELKRMAEEELEGYDDAMIAELQDQLKDYLDGISIEEVDSTEVYELIERWEAALPEPGTWAFDQVESKREDMADMEYESAKDEQMSGYRL